MARTTALAHFGHGAMSDLSPLCGSKRMSANGRVYEPSPTRTASWQLSMRGFEGPQLILRALRAQSIPLRTGCDKSTRRANFRFRRRANHF